MNQHVVIVGGGFAGLAAAKKLARDKQIDITLVDRRNHHLFQPLLYQVAMAGLSPADIAVPIRSIVSRLKNVRVVCIEVLSVDPAKSVLTTTDGELPYDYLLLACGALHSYFGNDDWELHAPGLKTIEQATEIRRRVLSAFETAELTDDTEERRKQLTFVVVGGGPTGVELAGAIGEMSRFTLSRDFRNIDSKQARIILVEAGSRILPMFSEIARQQGDAGSGTARRSNLDRQPSDKYRRRGRRHLRRANSAATVLWAAGVKAAKLGSQTGLTYDQAGRIVVNRDLSIPDHPNAFVAGDQCAFIDPTTNRQLPGMAPVAVQQGTFVANTIIKELRGKPREEFQFRDKGQMATIGRSRAIAEIGNRRFTGLFAWLVWLVVHIFFLTGFKNRLFVVMSWAWSFFTFRRGSRLIVDKNWRFYGS